MIHVFFLAGVFLAPLIPKGRVGGGHGGHGSQVLFLPTWYQVADQCSPYPRRARPWRTSVFLPTWYRVPYQFWAVLDFYEYSKFRFRFQKQFRTSSGPTQKWNLEFGSRFHSSNKYTPILVLPDPISVRFQYSENQVQFWVTRTWINNKHLISLWLAPNSSFFFPKNSRSGFTHKWNQELGLYSWVVSIPKIKLGFDSDFINRNQNLAILIGHIK